MTNTVHSENWDKWGRGVGTKSGTDIQAFKHEVVKAEEGSSEAVLSLAFHGLTS